MMMISGGGVHNEAALLPRWRFLSVIEGDSFHVAAVACCDAHLMFQVYFDSKYSVFPLRLEAGRGLCDPQRKGEDPAPPTRIRRVAPSARPSSLFPVLQGGCEDWKAAGPAGGRYGRQILMVISKQLVSGKL